MTEIRDDNMQRLWKLHEALPGPVRLNISGGAYIAGGSIVRSLLGLGICDVDVWTPNPEDLIGALLAEGYTQPPADESPPPSAGDGFGRAVMSKDGEYTIDVIGHDFGPAPEVCATFDFRCCMVALGTQFWAEAGALDDIAARRLTPMRRTLWRRIDKYLAMGFEMTVPTADVLLPAGALWAGKPAVPVGGGDV